MNILHNRPRGWGKSRETAMRMLEALRSGLHLMVASLDTPGWHVIRNINELRACPCGQCKVAAELHDWRPRDDR